MTAGATLPPTPAERRAAARAAELERRRADADRLRAAMPHAMAELAQWLLWRYEEVPGRSKPAKVPYYASGRRRVGEMGTPEDRRALSTLDTVLQRMVASSRWSGIGFAFLSGDGLIGIDVDHAIDPATGQPSELCRTVVESCASYTELSPSGTGVHVIVAGEGKTFKDDGLGLEVYAGARYFTCTGQRCSGGVWPETPAQVQPIDPLVMGYLRELVDQARAQRQEAAAAPAPEPSPEPSPGAAGPPAPAAPPRQAMARHQAPGQQGNDFARVNAAAYEALHKWVPVVLPAAKVWRRTGYRITSKALGRDLQEDLQLTPEGIMDFGEERGLSPVDVCMQWGPGLATPREAMLWLAKLLGVEVARGRANLKLAPPAPPRDEGDPRPEPPPASPPPGRDGDGPAPDAGEGAPAEPGEGGRRKRKRPPEFWELVDTLTERFSLIYGTDTAWDGLELMIIKVPAMRLAFGRDPVNTWLARPTRRMVRLTDLVFEPGVDVQPPQINMFAGLELEPVPATADDVRPMLALLRHLCSESRLSGNHGAPGDDVDEVMHWVLCWQALPLQQLGLKMQTAIVMHGAQGTGKNVYWDLWRDLFGAYGVTVGQTEIEDKFNGWISRKLAIIGDEVVSKQEMYHNKNRLKMVVTQETKFPIRDIQQATRWESNHANVVFISNENLPLVLEERDRRWLVIYTPLEADASVYEAARDFKRNGGAAKWLHYLQNYDVGDFTAHTKPLMTRAKEDLIEAGWRAPVRFGHEWLEGYLELPIRVCSAEQLYRAFRRWCDLTGARWPPDQASFTNELKRWVSERVKRGGDGRFEEPALVYKQIALKEDQTRRRTVRCWVPRGTGPIAGVTEGEWAWESVAAFETDLRKYTRRFGGAEEES